MSENLDQQERAMRDAHDEMGRLLNIYDQHPTHTNWTNFIAAHTAYHQIALAFWEAYRLSHPEELGYLNENVVG